MLGQSMNEYELVKRARAFKTGLRDERLRPGLSTARLCARAMAFRPGIQL
jgi:hypothetical protein